MTPTPQPSSPPTSLGAMLAGRAEEARRAGRVAGSRPSPRALLAVAALAGAYIGGLVMVGFSPIQMLNGLWRLGDIAGLMLPPTPGTFDRFLLFAHALGETLAIALLGTTLAAVIAVPLGLIAARNVVANRIVHFISRRCLDTVRGVDTLIWALIWINVVGLGPFAGVLAIMSSDIGTFGKLFSEAIEAADKRAVEGVTSTGGSHVEAVRFGVIPQVLPVILGQWLYYIESNTRSASVIGIVGAGGIGLHLSEQIRTLEWQHVSFIIAMILVVVAAIDTISGRLRQSIIGKAGH